MREYITSKDPEAWVWPSDWPNIEECPDNEILILIRDHNSWGFKVGVGNSEPGTFSIDWGDGTIENNLLGDKTTIHSHKSTTGGVLSERSGTVWKVRIFNASDQITFWKVGKSSSLNLFASLPVIAINFGTAYIDDFSNCFDPFASIVINGINGINDLTWDTLTRASPDSIEYCKIKSFQVCSSAKLMFAYCENLRKVVLPDSWGNVRTCEGMFAFCHNLYNIKLPGSWGLVTNLTAMFYYVYGLRKIKLPSSWGLVTTIQAAFTYCLLVESIELPESWGNINTVASAFNRCYALKHLNLPTSWGNITTIYRFLNQTHSLKSVIFPESWGNVSIIRSALQQAYGIKKLVLPTQFVNMSDASSAFLGLDLIESSGMEYIGSLTQQCDFTTFVFDYNFPLVINSLVSRFSLDANTGFKPALPSLRLLNQGSLFAGLSPQIMVSNSTMPKEALEILFGDIPNGLVSKTIAITGCTGTDALISKASSGTTTNSATITMADTSLLAAGMEVYGTGISTAKAVTFTDTGDIVNRTAHGLSNGMKISFSSITSTTGIVVNTTYFVVNKTNDTFQVSLTLGGSAIALTTNGSGNLIAIPTIVTINTNVSIVIDVPCSATASVTLTAGVLKRSIALLKGWTITN